MSGDDEPRVATYLKDIPVGGTFEVYPKPEHHSVHSLKEMMFIKMDDGTTVKVKDLELKSIKCYEFYSNRFYTFTGNLTVVELPYTFHIRIRKNKIILEKELEESTCEL